MSQRWRLGSVVDKTYKTNSFDHRLWVDGWTMLDRFPPLKPTFQPSWSIAIIHFNKSMCHNQQETEPKVHCWGLKICECFHQWFSVIVLVLIRSMMSPLFPAKDALKIHWEQSPPHCITIVHCGVGGPTGHGFDKGHVKHWLSIDSVLTPLTPPGCGSFHSHGGTPMAGWFTMDIPFSMDDFWGYPPPPFFAETVAMMFSPVGDGRPTQIPVAAGDAPRRGDSVSSHGQHESTHHSLDFWDGMKIWTIE